jgi:thiol-disulfide isomerase/thioredoxin
MEAPGRTLKAVVVAGLMLAFALGAARPSSGAGTLRFADSARPGMTLPPAAMKGRARVLVLWRADCGPCLLELENLKALEAAAGPADLVLVALDSPDVAQDKLRALGVKPRRLWYALDDNARVLTAMGGPPPRLPLAVALDRQGRICARRTGLLGTDIVKQWVSRCSS